MTDVKKFLFDTHDFGEAKLKANVYSEEQLRQAQEQAFALGKAEGIQETRQQQEEHITTILNKALNLSEALSQAENRREAEKLIESITLTMRVLRKLLPKFAAQYSLHEIEQVILQEVSARKDEPRIAVTVPAVHLEALKARIDAVTIEKGYAGKVILLADDMLAQTDCRVEWADGGAERLYERLYAQIETEFTKAISGIQAGLEQK